MPLKHRFSVPGRLCLAGEHSDWAADHRLQNSTLPRGTALVVGLNQCLTAEAAHNPTSLSLHSALAGTATQPIADVLSLARNRASPWRFAAAVAFLMHTRFTGVAGLSLCIVDSTLPAEKGFSSSAAVSVLAARAFNRVYNLRLSISAEMDFAFAAERMTGSPCGRMDQIVAIGPARVARMHFDIDFVDFKLVPLPTTGSRCHIVVADLGRRKDTSLILRSLQRAYPLTSGMEAEALRRYLGERNQFYVAEMEAALQRGDPSSLGRLMTDAQAEFDAAATPFCPEELTAPHLHAILSDEDVRPLVFGGKGVGSQGDGAVQFVARNEESAHNLVQLLKQKLGTEPTIVTPGTDTSKSEDTNGRSELKVTERNTDRNVGDDVAKVRQGIIPTAGYGTRLFPASRSVRPKAMLPVVDADGFTKPILLHLVEQVVAGGVEEVTIVTTPGIQTDAVKRMFSPVEEDLWHRLKPGMKEYAKRVVKLGEEVRIALQDTPEGFGHAVACAAKEPGWKEDEAFVVMLGDVVFCREGMNAIGNPDGGSTATWSCVREAVTAFKEGGGRVSVVGVTAVAAEEAVAYGVVQTEGPLGRGGCADISQLVEKPSLEIARGMAGEDGRCNIVLGPYVFTPRVMRELRRVVEDDRREGGEIQLTTAMVAAMKAEGMRAVHLHSQALDTGNSRDYARSFSKLACLQ